MYLDEEVERSRLWDTHLAAARVVGAACDVLRLFLGLRDEDDELRSAVASTLLALALILGSSSSTPIPIPIDTTTRVLDTMLPTSHHERPIARVARCDRLPTFGHPLHRHLEQRRHADGSMQLFCGSFSTSTSSTTTQQQQAGGGAGSSQRAIEVVSTYDLSGELSWDNPAHELDDFWKQNAKKLVENDPEDLRLLVNIIERATAGVNLDCADESGPPAATEDGGKAQQPQAEESKTSVVLAPHDVSKCCALQRGWQATAGRARG
ncbi:hypothetical protein A4X09_0g2309 [Tilletia walkeri]|uniref:ATPase V1 complex subunit H C-terminal domain-containing protein n=1 Tax=Tilletia walkeri TaxID=117179 RepID=A0A8X7NBS1_9BASI|nr:hypothetical protein A4X09_0g2309 [Tilletia walkeri]